MTEELFLLVFATIAVGFVAGYHHRNSLARHVAEVFRLNPDDPMALPKRRLRKPTILFDASNKRE